jgi:ABC-type transporter Mla MlaB component
MGITVEKRTIGNVLVVDVAGRITVGSEGSREIRQLIECEVYGVTMSEEERGQYECFPSPTKGRWPTSGKMVRILLNLGEVTYIDSSGMNELIWGFEKVKRNAGEIKILNLAKKVKDLLQISKLYTVFDVHEDEPAAIHSFR